MTSKFFSDTLAFSNGQAVFDSIDPRMNTVNGVHANSTCSTLPVTNNNVGTIDAVKAAADINNTAGLRRAATFYNQAFRVNGTTYY